MRSRELIVTSRSSSNGKLHYLIEVKAIGSDLKENHVKQAVDYAANEGVDWVLLTTG